MLLPCTGNAPNLRYGLVGYPRRSPGDDELILDEALHPVEKLAPHGYAKTSFSYVERDTGREYWVEVPEQPEELDAELAEEAVADEVAPTAVADGEGRDTTSLMAAGENKRVEFKASACSDHQTGNRNKERDWDRRWRARAGGTRCRRHRSPGCSRADRPIRLRMEASLADRVLRLCGACGLRLLDSNWGTRRWGVDTEGRRLANGVGRVGRKAR